MSGCGLGSAGNGAGSFTATASGFTGGTGGTGGTSKTGLGMGGGVIVGTLTGGGGGRSAGGMGPAARVGPGMNFDPTAGLGFGGSGRVGVGCKSGWGWGCVCGAVTVCTLGPTEIIDCGAGPVRARPYVGGSVPGTIRAGFDTGTGNAPGVAPVSAYQFADAFGY